MQIRINRQAPIAPPVLGVTLTLTNEEWYDLKVMAAVAKLEADKGFGSSVTVAQKASPRRGTYNLFDVIVNIIEAD